MNENRRNFLKFIFVGAIAIFAGRVLGFLKLENSATEAKVGDNFNTREENGKIVFANKKGEKVFTINDSGEMEIG